MTEGRAPRPDAGDRRTGPEAVALALRDLAPWVRMQTGYVDHLMQTRIELSIDHRSAHADVDAHAIATEGDRLADETFALLRQFQRMAITGLGLQAELDRQIAEANARTTRERERTIERIVALLGLRIEDTTSQRLVREVLEQVAREEVRGG